MSDRQAAGHLAEKSPGLGRAVVAEAIGTFLLVLLGCGVVHSAVLLGAQQGVWQVAVVWGLAIMLAIYCVGAISGAHLNPAMTIAFALWGRHRWSWVLPYLLGQWLGAFLAAGVLFLIFQGFLAAKEEEKGVVRGEPGSIVTAMCYGEYSPNPGSIASMAGQFDAAAYEKLKGRFSPAAAWFTEFLGTMILALVVFALTDPKNQAASDHLGRPTANLAPVFIGLTVSALISVMAPLTQAGFNPARDFGPRCFAFIAGWGSVAIPGLSDLNWLTVYIVAPIVGAIAGSTLYQVALRR